MNSTALANCGDDSFGPSVSSQDCRGGFDLTLLFEESILAILPAAIFLLVTPFRASRLVRQTRKLKLNALYAAKLLATAVYVGLQLTLLVLSSDSSIRTHATIAAASLTFVSALMLAPLSHLEHGKSSRPSFLISFYLGFTAILDIARVRTQWFLPNNRSVAAVLTVSLIVKCLLLTLEEMGKRSLLPGTRSGNISLESTSGLFNRSTFWWLNSLLLQGSKNILDTDALPPIREKLASNRLGETLQSNWKNCNQNRRHALAWACTWGFRYEIMLIAVPKFCYVALSLSQTFLIRQMVTWVQNSDAASSNNTGYGLIGAFAFVYIGLALTMGWASHLTYRLMTMMRGSLITIIYDKMATLPMASSNDSAAMTLMGTDVARIAETYNFLLIDAPPALVQLGIALYLLYSQLGAVCIAPIIVTILSTGLSTQLAGLIGPRQKAWIQTMQKRINFTSEILGFMTNIKMLGLANKMASNIRDMRQDEMETSKKFRTVQSLNISLVNIPPSFNRFFIFAAYAIVAHVNGTGDLSVAQAITALAALSLLSTPLSTLLVAIPTGWGALSCFTRIQEFLVEESRIDPRSTYSAMSGSWEQTETQPSNSLLQAAKIRVNHASFGWSASKPDVVRDVTSSIKGEAVLTIVIGPVGCGKSTLLKGLLGESARASGSVHVSSLEIAYCDQTPWISNCSIRENIIFGSEFDANWYNTVLQACTLHVDVADMPGGDSVIVGSKGVKLSGGQKQRLSIARALYSRKKLAILDDVFSGLDSATEDSVFRGVFGRDGLFKKIGTTVILATHSVKHIPHADFIIALNSSGELVEQGSFIELNVPGTYTYGLQVKVERGLADKEHGNKETVTNNKPEAAPATKESASDESRQTGDWTVYKYYMQALGPMKLLIFVLLVVSYSVVNAMGSVWVNWWASSNETSTDTRLGYWLGIFGFLSFMEVLLMTAAIAFLWIVIVPNSGSSLHKALLGAVMSAPLSFFSKTDTGVLTNRFSQDLRLADMTLPGSIINVTFQFAGCGVVIALAVSAVGYFAAVLPFILVTLYFIQRFYLRTSRQLRLLELEAAAPLFTHFTESLDGLTTIRSFGWTAVFAEKSRHLLDRSQKPYYLLFCIQRWLVLVLDLIVACLAIILVGLAVALHTRVDPGLLGIALVNMISLSHSLTSLVQYWTMLETSLGAIARIKNFAEETPAEKSPSEQKREPSATWPETGALRFQHVHASYSEELSPVIQDVSFSIKGGEKLGIVGRTGSGKSSSILAILRMIDVVSGEIILDDIDLAGVDGSVIRQKLNCLTQDPFLFPGTLRDNMKPVDEVTDEAIISALQKVDLWTLIENKAGDNVSAGSGVLDYTIDKDFLSHGQRQLFCLARAMLKPGRVLILDEPTSSVDLETDAKMQEIIRAEFKDHTIIVIAHRLSSILDFDHVAVLDAGHLVEFGKPADLLEIPTSNFTRLYGGRAQ
ncbi:hypothetical protein PFICI_06270 [Pestalotiopsis fici W106-1]|uniref:Uncharacterized protein n=1 Tax=Pestalotiopsis fici (strain W106-1 / CGMCC3.15140) TaxID=1229662 RepID=W3X594_PESFW|nr:uncharacterized protein PFICI_06270 [Pestalotiopsis fici W106-1]ETS81268.1 hypothetical protein PFICI_06270 [Pestalotiopsis fici W106-1]